MKCAEIKEFLSAYANNELSPIQREFVEEHLRHCSNCRKTLESYVEVKEKLTSLQTIPVTSDLSQATTFIISSTKKEKWTSKILRPILVTIPVLAILITLAVLQPWTPVAGPNAVIAKSIDATGNVITYRVSSSPFITFMGMEDTEMKIDAEWEFVLPDRTHLKINRNGKTSESIYIENLYYYQGNIAVIIPVSPSVFIDAPSKENIIQELELADSLEQLPDECIDGVNCFHFKWIDSERAYTTIELWMGKEDYLIRQRISRTTMPDGTVNTSTSKYYDFNQPISIKAPVTSSGELLEGWTVVDLASAVESDQNKTRTGTTTTTGITTTVKP